MVVSGGTGDRPIGVFIAGGIGLTLGALIAGPISGGHMNPAVTLAMYYFYRLPK